MIRSGYGVSLEPLTSETAEQVRLWRNDPQIRAQMEFRETISPEMQQRWFDSVQNDRFAYFLIRAQGEPLGLIHLADIDPVAHTAEAGLFVGEKRFSGTGIALGASLLLLEYAFDERHLERVFAKVKTGNEAAETYNRLLGFVPFPGPATDFFRLVLEKETFLLRKKHLQALLQP